MLALLGIVLIAIAWSAFSADHVEVVLSDCSKVSGKYSELQKPMCMASNAFISSLPESIQIFVEGVAYLLGGAFQIYLAWVIWPKLDDAPTASN
jgi:hypothetical protein